MEEVGWGSRRDKEGKEDKVIVCCGGGRGIGIEVDGWVGMVMVFVILREV